MRPAEGIQKQIEIYRLMTGAQRLCIGFELYETAIAICHAGIKRQYPDWGEREIKAELVTRLRDAATRLY